MGSELGTLHQTFDACLRTAVAAAMELNLPKPVVRAELEKALLRVVEQPEPLPAIDGLVLLHATQRRMYLFIVRFSAERGCFPTFEEMRQGLGLATKSMVDYHLGRLVDAGLVTKCGHIRAHYALAKG